MINSPHKPGYGFEQGKNAAEYTPDFYVTQPMKERWEIRISSFYQKKKAFFCCEGAIYSTT
jgi:hypothetical protein